MSSTTMTVLQAIFPCIPAKRQTSTPKTDFPVDEKLALYTDQPSTISISQAADSVIDTLLTAEKAGDDLKSTIDTIVHQAGGWSERIATRILNGLVNVLHDLNAKMGPVLKEAYEKACNVAVSSDLPCLLQILVDVSGQADFANVQSNP